MQKDGYYEFCCPRQRQSMTIRGVPVDSPVPTLLGAAVLWGGPLQPQRLGQHYALC